jgi:predicted N-acyltransferase
VPRGFEPCETWSAHWIADRRFRRAIGRYLDEERPAVDEYIRQVQDHVPFHRGPVPPRSLDVEPDGAAGGREKMS